MDATVITLKILAVYLVVSGFFLVFKGKTVPHLLKDFVNHPAVSYLTGIILIFLSTMYLIQYNIWTGTVETIVTIVAWLVGVKGLLYIFAPKSLSTMVIKRSRKFFTVYGVIAIAVGVYLFMMK